MTKRLDFLSQDASHRKIHREKKLKEKITFIKIKKKNHQRQKERIQDTQPHPVSTHPAQHQVGLGSVAETTWS
jgi:hypothetical protein